MSIHTVRPPNSRLRSLALAAVSALALACAAVPAYPQSAVYCVNCSTATQQLLGYARQLLQLQNEIQTVTNTLNTYTNAVQNTLNLPNTLFSDITGDINNLTHISSGASLLSNNSATFLTDLASRGGYSPEVAQNWAQRIIQEQNDVAQKTTAFAQMMQLQPSQLSSYSTTLAALESQAQNSTGRQQTLQAIAGINAAVGQQIKTSQATLSAAMQAQLAVSTAQADRQALQDALWQQFSHFTPLPMNGQGFGAP